jgi:predicted transcriptional regulator
MVPRRGLSPAEARIVAERQATKLLVLGGANVPPVSESLVRDLAGVKVERKVGWPTSGMATSTGAGWVIVLKAEEAHVRQRFSLAHEFKHVLDDRFIEWLYPTVRDQSPEERAELVCDHFAACLLMPRAWIKRDFGKGIQAVELLARRYDVSRVAMNRRLIDLRLREPAPRCAGTRREGLFE